MVGLIELIHSIGFHTLLGGVGNFFFRNPWFSLVASLIGALLMNNIHNTDPFSPD